MLSSFINMSNLTPYIPLGENRLGTRVSHRMLAQQAQFVPQHSHHKQTKTFVGEKKKNIWSKRKQELFHNSLIVIITLSTQTGKDRMKTREARLR